MNEIGVKTKIIEYIKTNRVSTTEIADCLGKKGVIENVQPLNQGHFCVGEIAYYFSVGESNWNVHEDLQKGCRNKIVFIDAIDVNNRAIVGDIVSKYVLLYQGAYAIVTNGKMRDAHTLLKENYPIWCGGVSPVGCFNKKVDTSPYLEEINIRRKFFEGSIAVCDDSGCVVIPKNQINQDFLSKIEKIEEQEDIWYDCIDQKKWSTYRTICLKEYLTKDERRSNGVRDIDKYANDYLEASFLKENVDYRRRLVLEQLKKYKHDSILEIGCGMFPLFQYLRGSYNQYYIVEPSDVFADNAKQIAGQEYNTHIYVYQSYLEDIVEEIQNIKPDFIICSSLLHKVPDERCLLQAINRIATDETVIHINVPNAMSVHRILAKSAGIIDNIYEKSETQKKLQQRSIYDLNTLKTEVMECGFMVLDEGSYFIKPFTHKQMDMMLKSHIIDEQVLEGLWNLIEYFPDNGSEIYVNMRKSMKS